MEISPPVTDLIMVGACYIDTILRVSKYPAEDEKLRASSLEKRRGGNGANSLEVLQQLTHLSTGPSPTLHLLCCLPNRESLATKFIRESLSPNVDLSLSVHRDASSEAASSYIIKSTESGSRTIVNYNDLPEMTLSEFEDQIKTLPESASRRTWYHFEGRVPETSLACIRWLRKTYADVLISVEAEKPARPGLFDMAAEADVVFFSKSWAQSNGYGDVGSFLRAQAATLKRAKLLCCTWGGEGAAVIEPADGAYHHESAFLDKTKQVVDTVGAGDTFVAGVLHRLITSQDVTLQSTLAFANELAGRKVLQDGFADLV